MNDNALNYSIEGFRREAADLLSLINECRTLEEARERLFRRITDHQYDPLDRFDASLTGETIVRRRDCARAFCSMSATGS